MVFFQVNFKPSREEGGRGVGGELHLAGHTLLETVVVGIRGCAPGQAIAKNS